MKRPAVFAVVLLLAAVGFVALLLRAHLPEPHVQAEPVATLPLKSPAQVLPAMRLTLPEQRGPRPGQVFLGWRLLDDRLSPNTLVLRWDSNLDPLATGCGSRPVAIQVGETADSIRIGLVGPIPPPRTHCLESAGVAYIDVHLSRPAGHRTVYEITG